MSIEKAYGYIVNCDQMVTLPEKEGGPGEEVPCNQRLLVLTPSHSEGKYGGEFVIQDAKRNGYLYDRVNRKFACQSCFQKLESEGKVEAKTVN